VILGIETSCDETSVALLDGDGAVRVNLIASQIERHRPFGGVVPEIASREHLQHLFPLVGRALDDARASWSDIDRIAVTAGPGLIGALLVGVAGAQGLSYALGVPLTPVNHLEGHIFASFLTERLRDYEPLAFNGNAVDTNAPVSEPKLAGQLWVKGEPKVRLYSTVQATFAALAALEAEGKAVRVAFVHDRGSGNKLFADKVWYVKTPDGLSAFLLKKSAADWAAKNAGTVLGYRAARKAL